MRYQIIRADGARGPWKIHLAHIAPAEWARRCRGARPLIDLVESAAGDPEPAREVRRHHPGPNQGRAHRAGILVQGGEHHGKHARERHHLRPPDLHAEPVQIARDASRLTPSHGDLHFEIVGDGLVAPGRLRTVEAQRKQIMKKLDLHETAELVRFAPRRQG